MASRSVFPLRGVYKMPGIVIVAGSFVDAGGSDPTTIIGEGFSVSHTGNVGRWTVTLDETYPFLVAASCNTHVRANLDISTYIREGEPEDLIEGSIKSFEIVQTVAGSASEVEGRVISFVLFLANSTLAKNRSS